VLLDHIDPMFFLPLVTLLLVCINLTTYYTFALFFDTLGCGICVWIGLLSHAVMSHCISLPSFMMLSWLVVYCENYGFPSVVM
jgi:hypothetical protein